MAHGILYRCFMRCESAENQYVEFTLKTTTDEETVKKLALRLLKWEEGELDDYAEEIVELTKTGKLCRNHIFTASPNGNGTFSTSLAMGREGYVKLLKILDWLTEAGNDGSEVTVASAGHPDFIPLTDINDANKPFPLEIPYIGMRLLSAATQQEFHGYEELADALKGGPEKDLSRKYDMVRELRDKGLITLNQDCKIELTERGIVTLGRFEVPLDLDHKKEEVIVKEYNEPSGIQGLSDTAEAIMRIVISEGETTKARLKAILYSKKIYNLYGIISKSTDALVKHGHLTKSEKVSFSKMTEKGTVSVPVPMPEAEYFTLEALAKNTKNVIVEFAKRFWKGKETTPENQKAIYEELQNKLFNLGVFVSEEELVENSKDFTKLANVVKKALT